MKVKANWIILEVHFIVLPHYYSANKIVLDTGNI